MSFRINTPHVSHELVDGEVIIVHVLTGAYYSLRGSGAAIWSLLEHGAAPREICAAIGASTAASIEAIAADVERFVGELQTEQLIVPSHTMLSVPVPSAYEGPVPFESPRLEKYTDMEELLLVDPIHEVSPKGWPEQPSGSH